MASAQQKVAVPLQCANCGGDLTIESAENGIVTCSYCGSHFSVADLVGSGAATSPSRSTKIKSGSAHTSSAKGTSASSDFDKFFKQVNRSSRSGVSTAKQSSGSRTKSASAQGVGVKASAGKTLAVIILSVLFFFFACVCLGSFMNSAAAGLLSLAQTACMGYIWNAVRKGRVQKSWIIAATAIIIVLIAPWMSAVESYTSSPLKQENITWTDLTLAQHAPTFDADKGHIYSNDSDRLDVEFADVSESDFNSYVNACREAGYTIEQEIGTSSFEAFNQDGYKLTLYRFSSNNEMDLTIDAPKPMGKFIWPTGTLADTVPDPGKPRGYISTANSSYLTVYVDGMTKDETIAYEQACVDAGYSNIDDMSDADLRATDNKGHTLRVSYEGNQVMSVEINTS